METSTTINIIITLPDEILSHILSFLQTKLAFSTTILSKRWEPLHISLTSLHFDPRISVHDERASLCFCRFANMVMLL
ncbi:putative F-box domain-containing protein [Medicago truncatula]|uniref:F-box/LRR protein n=1 Tax=Medicago truncatula TaxID=3880 RepID=G7KNS2_MEDTR|nr:F-box/LRR protein [Medicago truncatula]RHN52039.1 putative F-box domain-containing protein [Medicago truncatula]